MFDFIIPENLILNTGLFFFLFFLSVIFNMLYFSIITLEKFRIKKNIGGSSSNKKIWFNFTKNFFGYFSSISIITFLIKFYFLIVSYYYIKKIIPFIKIDVMYLNIILYLFLFIFYITFVEVSAGLISKKKAEKIVLNFNFFLIFISKILFPIKFIIYFLSSLFLKLFNMKYSVNDFNLNEDEIEKLVRAGKLDGSIDKDEYEMISGVLDLEDTTAKNIMIPQPDVKKISIDISLKDLVLFLDETKYSRLPVYRDTVDNIVGILYGKELISLLLKNQNNCNFDLKKYLKKPLFIPESKTINLLLKDFKKEKTHIAIVVDEYGNFSGIVTIEDILEEIVGDIQDEFDNEEELIIKNNKNEYIIDAKINTNELNEKLKINIPESEDYESLGGFLELLCDDIPLKDEIIVYNDFKFQILSSDNKKINKILLK